MPSPGAALRLLGLAAAMDAVAGHGYMYEPYSRTRAANDAGLDYCPHCALASPMVSEAPGASSRPYPGSRAFADPGTASSEDFLQNGFSPFGVCGQQKLGTNDYNYPGGNVDPATGLLTWGETFTEVQAGEVLDVSWCVNADHGGLYMWRLCDDPVLVAKLWGDGPMTPAEQEELEDCYQRGELRCDDVPSNAASSECDIGYRCAAGWGCHEAGTYFHCGDDAGTQACAYHSSGRSCNGGVVVERKVLIPRNFPTGPTVMSWRWDSLDTVEVFAGCADIIITPAENTPTQSPVPKPTNDPALPPVPAPTPAPPPEDGPGYCCWYSPAASRCSGQCTDYDLADEWCGESQARCESCGNGEWCFGLPPGVDPDPTPAPVPAPTPTPPTPGNDCSDICQGDWPYGCSTDIPWADYLYCTKFGYCQYLDEPSDNPNFCLYLSGPTPSPTKAPTTDRVGFEGPGEYCCFAGGCTDECYAPVFGAYDCGTSKSQCESQACGGVWCGPPF